MKSNYSAKQLRMRDWDHLSELVINNLLMVCITLAQDYGFGKKRMRDFLYHVMETKSQIDEWIADGVREEKCKEIIDRDIEGQIRIIVRERVRNIMPPECFDMFYGQQLRYNDVKQNCKRMEKRSQFNGSVSEAADLQDKMFAFRDYMRDKSDK